MYHVEKFKYLSESEIIEYIPSRFVKPELAYINAIPNNIKHEDNPPNKKYVRADPVDDSEFLCIADIIYKLKLCNSIHKYIEPKSPDANKSVAPVITNIIINAYSIIVNCSDTLFMILVYSFIFFERVSNKDVESPLCFFLG